MTTETPARPAGATPRGWIPENHPRYTGAGWNFINGKNLKPNQPPTPPAPAENEEASRPEGAAP